MTLSARVIRRSESVRLPDFIAVGPPRTGTTWLHRVLETHVGLPAGIKETQFFVWNHARGLEWYRSFFRGCSRDRPVGEIAPACFDHPEARERIAALIPRCRVLCTLRDPVARVYSQYKVWHRAGLLEGPFDYARQRQQLGASVSYAFNLREWRRIFGGDNVKVLFHDDLHANPQAYIDAVCDFIGVAKIDLAKSIIGTKRIGSAVHKPRSARMAMWGQRLRDSLIAHRRVRLARLLEAGSPLWPIFFAGGHPYPPLDPQTEMRLREEFRPETEDLEELVGRDLSTWLISRAASSTALR
ncbi:MAG: sulfotransferase family protein [Candidatus Binataceae bacterium]